MSLRPRRRSHLSVVLLAMGVAALIAAPTSAASPALVVAGVDASAAPAVTVTVSSRFRPVLGEGAFPASAFQLSEDGRPREVTVEALAGDDLEVVLLLDTALSTDAGTFRAVVSAAAEFVLALPEGRAGVVESGAEPAVVAPLSADRGEVTAALGAIEPQEAGALHDAVPLALGQFSPAARGRVVVAVSAGADTASPRPLADVANLLRQSGAVFYGIDLRAPAGDVAALDRLAAAASGQLLTADDPRLLVGLLDLVAADLANSYQLSYRSEGEGRTPVTITVEDDGALAETTLTVAMPEPEAGPSGRDVPASAAPVPARVPTPAEPEEAEEADGSGETAAAVAPEPPAAAPPRTQDASPGEAPPVALWVAMAAVLLLVGYTLFRRRRRRSAAAATGVPADLRGLAAAFKHLPRVLPYLRPYRLLMVLAALFTLLSVLVSLAQPWPLAFLVDSALGAREPPEIVGRIVGASTTRRILFAVLAGLVITLVGNGVSILNAYVQTRLEQRMILDLRSEMFDHVQRLSLAFHDRTKTGGLMFAINYQAASVGQITVAVLPLVQNVLTVVGMGYVAYRLDARLALLSLTVVPFIYYSTRFYANRVEPRLRHVRTLEGDSLSIVHEAISMLRVIVAFGRERYEHHRFRTQAGDAVDARIDVTVRQTGFSLGVNLLTAAGTALVIGYGALLVVGGNLTIGQLLVVMAYIAAVYQPLEQISGTAAALQEQLISLEAAVQLLDTDPEVKDPPGGIVLDRIAGRVTFEDVHFSYQGRVDTLKDVSFDAPAGEVVAIVGPTGAGKSTLVSLIPRFFDPKQGRVLVDGIDVRSITLESLRQQVSIVLQDPLLFSGTIADNIRYGRLDANSEDVTEAARAANAHDFITRLPLQYDTVLGERGAHLSGGERQRISIARAFLKDAPILILDEPTSSIDSRTEAVILDALGKLMLGRTTFMIAHRLSTIRNAGRILVIDHGRLVEQGEHHELMEQGGLYREMYEAQNVQRVAAGLPRPAVIELPTDAGVSR